MLFSSVAMRPLIVFLLTSYCYADPIIIRSGVSTHKDEGGRHDASIYDLTSAKGASDYKGEQGYHQDNENKKIQAGDVGKYNEENSQKKLHSNEDNYAGDKFYQQQGGDVSDYNKQSANKKGHHKSGYTKSFHKDETASTSSFYDDADNVEDSHVHNDKKNLYGDAGQHSQRGSHIDDQKYLQGEDKNGYYHNAGNYEKDAGNRKDYNSKRYYDAKENEGRRNAAHQYDEADRYGHERYLKKHPHYYEPEPYVAPPKRTITIYEDPRYDGYEKYPSYDNDYIQLELKRPPRGYDYRYYDRPSYDYYY